jgi:carbon storage regulator
MLLLTRKPEQSLYIMDGLIKIEILEVRGSQVRIGITAPRHIDIHREEVYKRIKRSLKIANL